MPTKVTHFKDSFVGRFLPIVAVILACVSLPLFLVLALLIEPYEDIRNEDIRNEDYHYAGFKIIKLDGNNKLNVGNYSSPSSQPPYYSVNYDQYVVALKNGNGVAQSGDSLYKYTFQQIESGKVSVTLWHWAEYFVYEVRGTQIFPIKRKFLHERDFFISYAVSLLLVILAVRRASRGQPA